MLPPFTLKGEEICSFFIFFKSLNLLLEQKGKKKKYVWPVLCGANAKQKHIRMTWICDHLPQNTGDKNAEVRGNIYNVACYI